MDVLVDRCAGLDVHKDQVTVCVRRWGAGRRRESETRTFLTFRASLHELRLWLEGEAVTEVAMEATGVYLEAGVVPLGGGQLRAVVGQRPSRQEPARPQD